MLQPTAKTEMPKSGNSPVTFFIVMLLTRLGDGDGLLE